MKRFGMFVFCILITLTLACHKESEQDKVKTVITTVQKAAGEKNIKKIIDSLSKTYNDPQGNNYETIRGILIAYFYQYPKISVYIPNLDASVEGASAKAVFQAVLTGAGTNASASNLLPDTLGVYAFEVLLKKESGDWKVASAKWERVGDKIGS
jgi:hypothetical protein